VLMHFNGDDAATTFIDENAGGSSHTWTANGNAQLDTAEKKFGSASGLFDGTGDYVTTPDHADYTFGSGEFTVECWFNRAGGNGTGRCMIGHVNTILTSHNFNLALNTANRVMFDTTGPTVTGTTTFTATGWHHAAAVRTGDTLKLFVDGVQEGGDVAIVGDMGASTGALSVGRWGEANSQYWNGWIDEVRISKGIARWTANFTPPTLPYA
jgi:hypothetical protein